MQDAEKFVEIFEPVFVDWWMLPKWTLTSRTRTCDWRPNGTETADKSWYGKYLMLRSGSALHIAIHPPIVMSG